jgi:protease-4
MSFRTASALKRGFFLINPAFVHNHIDLVVDLYTGKPVDFGFNERQEEELTAKLPLSAFKSFSATQYYNVGVYSRLDDIPQGSVAVVNLLGPVLKYGDMCSYGMVDKATLLTRIAASGKFKSIVLNVDSPGGQADGTQMLADTIKNLSIPVIAVVDDGMMASAAMWIGSACSEIFATKTTDTFGSIGVYTSLYDFREYLKKAGVDIRDIYADQSFDKNKAYRDALDGDETLLKENLNFLATTFHNAVITNRAGKLVLSDVIGENKEVIGQEPLTGKMYSAQKALEIGLIDGIKSFDEILVRADELGDSPLSINPNQNNMFGNKFKSLSALKGKKAEEITGAQVDAVNSEIEAEEIAGVSLVLDSELTTAAAAVSANTSALASLNAVLGEGNHKPTLGEALTAFSAAAGKTATSLTSMTAERDSWKEKAVEYGAKNADEPTDTKQEGTDNIAGTAKVDPHFSQADADMAKMRAEAGFKPKAAVK